MKEMFNGVGIWLAKSERLVRLGPNFLTQFRFWLTPGLFILCLWRMPEFLPAVCLIDGFLDIADGALARATEATSPLGGYLDQLSDKASTMIRLGTLCLFDIFGGTEILPVWMWFNLLLPIFLFDAINGTLRTVEWFRKKKNPLQEEKKSVSSLAGKVKAWAQAFGIFFLSLGYAYRQPTTHLLLIWMIIILMTVSFFLLLQKKGKSWMGAAIVGVFVIAVIPDGHPQFSFGSIWLHSIVGGGFLLLALVLGLMSTIGQIRRRL